jgi:hypothetical protein
MIGIVVLGLLYKFFKESPEDKFMRMQMKMDQRRQMAEMKRIQREEQGAERLV